MRAPSSTSFPAAVRLGLEHIGDSDWVWIIHDDANPAPDALAALLAAAEADPEADVLGPKLREWPSLRRLLEVGVTISGTGRRETGLERSEYDQGQHDDIRTVLAVNTAGMLVRRTVLEELGGFDEQLPVFGNDIDFGWRAAAAGHKTVVVPGAVVFHVEAAHRGVRRTPLTGRHTHYQERRAAMYTLLANAGGWSLPWQVLRLGLGTLLRVVGFLLVRAVGQALDELAALVSLYGSPGQVLAARRERRRRRPAHEHDVRGLLAPWWLPYRHGLDTVSDLVTAVTLQAQDVAERRRAAAAAAEVDHPVTPRRVTPVDEDDGPAEDTGLVARFLTNPVALGLAAFVLLVLFGAREAIGPVSGGGLSAAPAAARDLWDLQNESWHALGQGTAVPAPPYVLPLAMLATLVGGSVSAAVSTILLLAVPVALWGAWRFLRVVGRLSDAAGAPRWLLMVAACTYALVPVVSGAWGDGRLGIVVVTAVLPWLGHAALGFADPEPDRRWRAAWRSGLLLALVAAFTPVAWFFAAALVVAIVGVGLAVAPSAVRDRTAWGPPVTMLAAVPLLLAPWWLPAVVHGSARSLLIDTGRLPGPNLGFDELLAGRLPGDLGAPWWLGIALVVMAVLALIPSRTRIPVLVVWIVALVAAATSAALGAVLLDLPVGEARPGLGFFLVVLRGAFVVAAVHRHPRPGHPRPPDRHHPAAAGPTDTHRGRGRGARARPRLVRPRGTRRAHRRAGHRHPGVHGPGRAPRTRPRHPRDPRQRRRGPLVRRPARRRGHHRRGRDPRRHPDRRRLRRHGPDADVATARRGRGAAGGRRDPVRRAALTRRRHGRRRAGRVRRPRPGQRRGPVDPRVAGEPAGRRGRARRADVVAPRRAARAAGRGDPRRTGPVRAHQRASPGAAGGGRVMAARPPAGR